MNVLILGEQLKLADQVRQLARLHGWQPHFTGLGDLLGVVCLERPL